MGVSMACSLQGRPENVRQAKSKVKSMLITFFDIKGIVHIRIRYGRANS
jgi:hypothetical protein